jgi:2-isopropylmalate synthase
VLGKHSGRAAFIDALGHLGVTLDDEELARAFARFKQLADRKGEISEEGLRAIVDAETGGGTDLMELVGIHVSGGNQEVPVAAVTLRQAGEERRSEAEGDGMVNAAFIAIQEAFGIDATLLDYRVSPLTSGADAMAEVNVIVQVGSSTFSGRGVSTDVVEGSAQAIVAALNKVLVRRAGADGR